MKNNLEKNLGGESYDDLLKKWLIKNEELKVKANAFEENPELWEMWEKLCLVRPMRFALVNLELPYDLAQYAQVVLSTKKNVPHVATYMVGKTLDFTHNKVRNKIMSWNIAEREIRWIPRVETSLEELKARGFRLIGTSPNGGVNALNYQSGERDIIVIGGAKGLSVKNIGLMDEMVRIPCSVEVPFLTTPTVIPILAYGKLSERGLWN